ncbi:nucleotide disphospho-sugar-binding domain-containing protein [Actinokineospora cianjurensis]|uniref:L-rhodinosyltransferase/glycosyltransferase/L-2-deoxyfucosyltransferase n=1 Tax=Actinokineospora cianjurensis TaxID=585224 RepID=A0A421AW60_9PSEU|nr:nucleotide disphospho-sugar-binding domain-containing protein [Actinokineospora cianjurensis]RLK53976.1 L-rhodinosyltransferase/glycosyltransferase/L-2-deoxyfucosyltransferase [Actinokineospora cianjurensis]
MRILIAVAPLTAHLYPSVPLAWALQGAGHEVRVGSNTGLVEQITSVGLTAVGIGERGSPPAPVTDAELDRFTDVLGFEAGSEFDRLWRATRYYMAAAYKRYHPDGQGRQELVDNLVGFARGWRPDLVIWDPACPAGSVAARECGAASARLMWGPDYSAWVRGQWLDRREDPVAAVGADTDPLAELLAPVFGRFGHDLTDDMVFGDFTVDPFPSQLPRPRGVRVVPMGWVPYAGAGPVPEWLTRPPERPRVCLSLGVTGRAVRDGGDDRVAAVFEAVADMEVEVVATVNADQLGGNLPVPANVRIVDYIPLTQVVPTCSAIIHHGGFGTFFAAAAHRVPQLIVMEDLGSALRSTRYLETMGAGVTLHSDGLTAADVAAQLSRLLTEPSFRDGAAALRADMAAAPSPGELVPVLERLAARYRGQGAG